MSATRPLLLTSIHDVSPRFEGEVDRLLDILHPHAGERVAMLVVPNHWGEAPLVPGSAFATRLRSWADRGSEIFLHGFFHRDDAKHARKSDRVRARFMTAGEGEFMGLTRDEAVDRITAGRELLEEVIGRPIDGFIAPAWLYGAGAMQALADCAVPIAEDHMRVWSPATGRQLSRGPVITWASRSRLRLMSSLAVAAALRSVPLRVLRVGVHPPDSRHPVILHSIEATLRAAAGRHPARYSDLLAA
jgi:uncharacterized protein